MLTLCIRINQFSLTLITPDTGILTNQLASTRETLG
jgi:hypothetical protein